MLVGCIINHLLHYMNWKIISERIRLSDVHAVQNIILSYNLNNNNNVWDHLINAQCSIHIFPSLRSSNFHDIHCHFNKMSEWIKIKFDNFINKRIFIPYLCG